MPQLDYYLSETGFKPVGKRFRMDEIGEEEIEQNVACIIETPKGSCVGDREFGTDQDWIDKPFAIQQMMIQTDLIQAIPKYERRVELTGLDFSETTEEDHAAGHHKMRVKWNLLFTGPYPRMPGERV